MIAITYWEFFLRFKNTDLQCYPSKGCLDFLPALLNDLIIEMEEAQVEWI